MLVRTLRPSLLALLFIPAIAAADNSVYRKVAPSTVWFFERGSASGVLIDAERRWILTAEHVVRDSLQRGKTDVKVIFAQFDANGNVLTEKSYYGFEKKRVLQIQGRVIRSNRLKDLALIELDKLPPGAKAITLARDLPQPGENVHVVGNSTFFNGGLFSYSIGKVRNSYFYDRHNVGDCFFALAHHAPTNRGDSGGPVVNDKAELVGIISSGTTGSGNEQVIDHSVHIREIYHFLSPANLPLVRSFSMNCTTNVPGQDVVFLPVAIGKQVSLDLKGSGVSDLDLAAIDFDAPKKEDRTLVNQVGTTDQEKGSFSPKFTGMCQVIIPNLRDASGAALTKKNTYNFSAVYAAPVQGPITIVRNLTAASADTIRVEFQASPGKVRVAIRGDGDTDLDLFIADPAGNEFVKETGTTDREKAEFTVNNPGVYTIRVANQSVQQFNRYVLTID
jgi:hypothetical protein